MQANPNRSKRTDELYRYEANRYLEDWLARPLDRITRRDIEARLRRHHRRPRLVAGQPGHVAAAIGLPPALRRPGGPANPVDLWPAGGRPVPPQGAAQDLGAGRGPAVLAHGHRGRGPQPGDPRRPLVRALHGHAPRGGSDPALGAGRHAFAHVPGRGDQDGHPPWSSPSPGRSQGFSNGAGPPPAISPPTFASGRSPPAPARPAMCRTRTISTGASARPAGRNSGSTVCATASSPLPGAS